MMNPLNVIENSLSDLGRKTALQALQPGLTSEEITTLLSAHNLNASESIIELYSWHNGTDPASPLLIGELCIIPGFYLLPLEEALVTARQFADHPQWRSDWLPILADGGGDFYVVATDDAGQVMHFMVDEPQTPVLAQSLPEYLEKIAQCFNTGIFFVEGDGNFEMDDDAYTHIFSDH